jgi:hypothetical protein
MGSTNCIGAHRWDSLIAELKWNSWKIGQLFRQIAELQVTCPADPAIELRKLKIGLKCQMNWAVSIGLKQRQVDSVLAHQYQLLVV